MNIVDDVWRLTFFTIKPGKEESRQSERKAGNDYEN